VDISQSKASVWDADPRLPSFERKGEVNDYCKHWYR